MLYKIAKPAVLEEEGAIQKRAYKLLKALCTPEWLAADSTNAAPLEQVSQHISDTYQTTMYPVHHNEVHAFFLGAYVHVVVVIVVVSQN